MANQISMTPTEMDNAARKAGTTAGVLEQQVIGEMDKLLETLGKSWKGEAIEGYTQRYKKIKGSLKNGVELLVEIEKNLKTSKKIIEETDSRISSQFKKM